jgi:D-glycero-alpha-D-manno-heptose-7-phosphate kinase
MVFACPFDRRLELERVLSETGVIVRPFSFVTHGVQVWSVEEERDRKAEASA